MTRAAVLATAIVTFAISGAVAAVLTFSLLGWQGVLPYVFVHWVLCWVVALPTALLVEPVARRVAARVVG